MKINGYFQSYTGLQNRFGMRGLSFKDLPILIDLPNLYAL